MFRLYEGIGHYFEILSRKNIFKQLWLCKSLKYRNYTKINQAFNLKLYGGPHSIAMVMVTN